MAVSRAVKQTNSRRCLAECPIMISRGSSLECSLSSKMRARVSEKTVSASSNETPCFARFAAAFSGSHSKRKLIVKLKSYHLYKNFQALHWLGRALMHEPSWNITFIDVLCSLHRSVTLVLIVVQGL